jgi:hypothetical protein
MAHTSGRAGSRSKAAPYKPPQVGDFVATCIFSTDHAVSRKTAERFPRDFDRVIGCSTKEGAEKRSSQL